MKKLFLINFLLAVSTSIGMTLLPIISTESLGVSLFLLGIIEGTTEFISNIMKLVSGSLFDRIKNKKYLFIVSVGIAFCSKLILFLFLNKYSVFASKILERFANGAFATPRDAYIIINAKRKGLSLSVLSCTKTLGCVVGTFIISMSTFWIELKENVFLIIFFTCFITFFAATISFYIKSPDNQKNNSFDYKSVKKLLIDLYPIYFISFVFFLARFNDSVLMMFLKQQGFPEWFYLSTISFFNISMFIISPVLGFLIDRGYQNLVLFLTLLSLMMFNIVFYCINIFPWIFACLGLIFWGIQRVGAQIVFSYLVSKKVPKELSGTAIGLLAIIGSFGNLISSSISGYYIQQSFFDVFICTGVISFLSILLMFLIIKKN